MIHYKDTAGVMVCDSKIEDAEDLAHRLREADVEEIWASSHVKPLKALLEGYAHSVSCLTILKNNSPVSMFGIRPNDILGNTAVIWLLGSDEIDKIQIKFLKKSRCFIKYFLTLYPILYNYVDARNKKSLKWLKFCGADISKAKPYGKEQLPFHFFTFQRGE